MKKTKLEFSKKLLVADYIVLIILLVCAIAYQDIDFAAITIAWIAQVGISSTAYYWKAKCENRTKIPLKVIESLPSEVQDKIDLTQVMIAIIQAE